MSFVSNSAIVACVCVFLSILCLFLLTFIHKEVNQRESNNFNVSWRVYSIFAHCSRKGVKGK